MDDKKAWRAKADKLLAAPVIITRSIDKVIGKVEDRFEQVQEARSRGMPWDLIGVALEDGEPLTAAAVESAFKRLCGERGMQPPRAVARAQASGQAGSPSGATKVAVTGANVRRAAGTQAPVAGAGSLPADQVRSSSPSPSAVDRPQIDMFAKPVRHVDEGDD